MTKFLAAGAAVLALGIALNWERFPSSSDYNAVYTTYTATPVQAAVAANSAR